MTTGEEVEIGEDVVVIRDAGDPLSPGFLSSFSVEGAGDWLSVQHFQEAALLRQMGLMADAQAVREAATARAARQLADKAISMAVPGGLDPTYLKAYTSLCRDAFLRQAYEAKLASLPAFKEELRKTAPSLLVHAEPEDAELGIGMDEVSFKYWMQQEGVSTSALYKAMLHPDSHPLARDDGTPIGRNRLGLLLLDLRASLERQPRPTSPKEPPARRMHRTEDGLLLSELVIALRGPFLPLSNRYALPITIHGHKFKSVEHYVYHKFLSAYGMPEKEVEKLLKASNGWRLHHAAAKALDKEGPDFDEGRYGEACEKLEKWYRKGMTAKLTKYPRLAQLLLATGDGLIVETSGQGDKEWSLGLSERQLQSLMAEKGLSLEDFLRYTTVGGESPPAPFRGLGLNRAGRLLMEMRANLDGGAVEALPLISPTDAALPSLLSHHLIAFTPESAFSPLAETPIKAETVSYASVQHFVLGRGCEALGLSPTVRQAILETPEPGTASVRFAEEVALACPAPEALIAWESTGSVEAMKTGLRLRLEQSAGLLRALLETGDALLAFCLRFLSSQLEWGVGMRERELRAWMHHAGLSAPHLARLTSLPLSERPPFLGGNRLGSLLMELRREFNLRGLFPRQMPELPASPEQILGSDSPSEDADLWDDEEGGQEAQWPNPFLALARGSSDERLEATARFARPRQPPWLRPGFVPPAALREAEERELRALPEEAAFAGLSESELSAFSELQLRHIAGAYVQRLRRLRTAAGAQAEHGHRLQAELGRLSRLRAQLEADEAARRPPREPTGPDGLTESQRNQRRLQERMQQLLQKPPGAQPSPMQPQTERRPPRTPSPPRQPAKAKAPTPPPPKQPRPDAEDGECSDSD